MNTWTTNNATTCDYKPGEMLAEIKRIMATMPKRPTTNIGGPGLSGLPYELRPMTFMSDRKQVRFPRSKKRRMRRKWAKRQENYRDVPKPDVYLIDGQYLVGHPDTISRLQKVCQEDVK